MNSIAACLHEAKYSALVGCGLERLRGDDPRAYPREAHHSYLAARALEASKHEPVLEADYWRNHYKERAGGGSVIRPRADLWRHNAFGETGRELFVEIKLAGLWGAGRRVGTISQQEAVTSWALDIWRLLVGTRRAHCGFVLCSFGDGAAPWTSSSHDDRDVPPHVDARADDVYEKLCAVPAEHSASRTVNAFLEGCSNLLRAKVSRLDQASCAGLNVWTAVVEWLQDSPSESEWVA